MLRRRWRTDQSEFIDISGHRFYLCTQSIIGSRNHSAGWLSQTVERLGLTLTVGSSICIDSVTCLAGLAYNLIWVASAETRGDLFGSHLLTVLECFKEAV